MVWVQIPAEPRCKTSPGCSPGPNNEIEVVIICGIAGFSKHPSSRLNARHLAHNLLAQIEKRGDHASGYAWIGPDGSRGHYKNNVPGGQLTLGELPRNAVTVILHTRFATQGSTADNRNNHPVLSTDNSIALVHNGVISNDLRLRAELGIDPQIHGEVDSLVIPSLIAQQGYKALNKLAGYAAIAWINMTHDAMFLARLKNSPVSYTHTEDGSFVFASTSILLERALENADVNYGGIIDMPDGKIMVIQDGWISEYSQAPSMSYDSHSYSRYSNATSGGHGSTSTASAKPSDTRAAALACTTSGTGKQSIWGDDEVETIEDVEAYFEALEKYREEQGLNKDKGSQPARQPEVIFRDGSFWERGFDDSEEDAPTEEELISILENRDDEGYITDSEGEVRSGGFYILDAGGDVMHYATLDKLEAALRWTAGITRTENDIWQGLDDSINWANHIWDIGAVDEDGTLDSWVDDMAGIDDFESPAVRNLQYIREGVGKLESLRGA